MGKKYSKLSNITKEFDELVKLQNSLSKPLSKEDSILSLFGFFPKKLSEKIKKFSSLTQDQYFAVINAADALKQYGKEGIGQEIYHENLLTYYISKKANDLISNLFE